MAKTKSQKPVVLILNVFYTGKRKVRDPDAKNLLLLAQDFPEVKFVNTSWKKLRAEKDGLYITRGIVAENDELVDKEFSPPVKVDYLYKISVGSGRKMDEKIEGNTETLHNVGVFQKGSMSRKFFRRLRDYAVEQGIPSRVSSNIRDVCWSKKETEFAIQNFEERYGWPMPRPKTVFCKKREAKEEILKFKAAGYSGVMLKPSGGSHAKGLCSIDFRTTTIKKINEIIADYTSKTIIIQEIPEPYLFKGRKIYVRSYVHPVMDTDGRLKKVETILNVISVGAKKYDPDDISELTQHMSHDAFKEEKEVEHYLLDEVFKHPKKAEKSIQEACEDTIRAILYYIRDKHGGKMYAELFGFDFAIGMDGKKIVPYFLEINSRPEIFFWCEKVMKPLRKRVQKVLLPAIYEKAKDHLERTN